MEEVTSCWLIDSVDGVYVNVSHGEGTAHEVKLVHNLAAEDIPEFVYGLRRRYKEVMGKDDLMKITEYTEID